MYVHYFKAHCELLRIAHLQIVIIIIVFARINISRLRTLFNDTRDRLSDDSAICTNVFAALYIPKFAYQAFAWENISYLLITILKKKVDRV